MAVNGASSSLSVTSPASIPTSSSTSSGHRGGGDAPLARSALLLRAGSSQGGVADATCAAAPSEEVARGPPGSDPCCLAQGLASPTDWGSPGLGGLAAGLAAAGKPRPALQAAIAALQAAGVSEPADMVLLAKRLRPAAKGPSSAPVVRDAPVGLSGSRAHAGGGIAACLAPPPGTSEKARKGREANKPGVRDLRIPQGR